jgi:hypothetical protein
VLWVALYINPRSFSRSEAEIFQIFSHMQHDVSEALSDSQHVILVGDFNAHSDNLPDHFPEGHVAMLSRFPELGITRLGQYKGRANTAGRCLRDIALETPLILTTGRGKGDNGQPTFFGYNPPVNPSRTEHILMSTALFSCCKQISVLHEFDSADHRPLLCRFSCQRSLPHIDLRLPGHIQRRGKGKHMVWRDEHKDAFVPHMLENETVLQSFRNSIRNQEHQSCYKHFLDLITLAADSTGMTARQMSRRMQLGLSMAPWYDATCRDYKRRIR